ncbi:MAG TPA: DHA2 family efflux MFS transporter permease subunit [Kineosporiaceae bacterium]|nr:DHA2 family efflux MFS transporter permease subunit [Kineosporiaceae bacterium]
MIEQSADRTRWWALAALVLSALAVGLDSTVLSVALPTLATDLHASTAQLQWFVDGYNLVLAAALLPAGLLGDRFGRKRLLLAALAAFGAASIWCAYAGSATELIGARVLLALGAAFLMTMPASVLPVIFPAEERTRAVMIWTTAMFVSFPLGPIVGGLLLNNFWWGSVFLINVPVVAFAMIAVGTLMPESRSPHRSRFDPIGLSLAIAGLVALTYGVIESGERGWSDGLVWSWLAAAVVLMVGFVWWERRAQARVRADEVPLIDLSIFRLPGFTWGILIAVLATFAMFGILFAGPQYFQNVLGYDALGTGIRQLPMIAGLLVGSRLAGLVVARSGAKLTVGIGFAAMAGGLLLGSTTSIGDGFGLAATWMAIIGIGMGFTLPTAMDAAIGAIPADRSGMGSGLMMSLRMVGGSIGVALLGSLVNSGYRGALDLDGLPPEAAAAVRDGAATGVRAAAQLGSEELLDSVRAAFVHGLDVMLIGATGVALLGLVLGVLFLPNRSGLPHQIGQPAQSSGESEHDVVRS